MVFVDPIMGDEGKLYNSITEKTVGHMRKLIAASDYMVPNYTEAVYLAGWNTSLRGSAGIRLRFWWRSSASRGPVPW